jgi:hypothetical protein
MLTKISAPRKRAGKGRWYVPFSSCVSNVSLTMNAQNDELKDANHGSVGSPSNVDRTTSTSDVSSGNGSGKENNQNGEGNGDVIGDVISKEGGMDANHSSDHTVVHSESEFADTTQPLDQTSNTPVHSKDMSEINSIGSSEAEYGYCDRSYAGRIGIRTFAK